MRASGATNGLRALTRAGIAATMTVPPPTAAPAPTPARRGEPPLIERARRIGWVLMGLSLLLLGAAREGLGDWLYFPGGAAAMFGLLAVVNVALVRSLYRQIEAAPQPPPSPPAPASEQVTQPD